MITVIEIDGFKTFKDFKVELAPFQVIVGPNGSGKSNLFDALHLLSRLMEDDIATAFQKLRGGDYEQFTALSEGKYTDKIRIAAEMLVDRKVRDELGKEAELKYTRLRYEVELTQGIDEYGLERLNVSYESLKSIAQNEDNWCRTYGLLPPNEWIPEYANGKVTFIGTDATINRTHGIVKEAKQPVIILNSDGDKQEIINTFSSKEVLRTVLSSITSIAYPHAYAAREEFRSLRFLHLNPEALRQPSSMKAPRFISTDGSNLPTMLARMQAEDKFALNDVSLDLANLVPELTGIELIKDEIRNEYTIWAHYQDGRSFASRVLSDGTLHLLALATLKNDPQLRGVICLEEPENSVDPSYLKNIAHLLKELATNLNDPVLIDEPLKQVLITTHSPTFISQPDVIDSLLFAYTVTRVEPGKHSMQVTQMVPVVTSNTSENLNTDVDEAEESYTLHQIERYLDSGYLDKARTNLGRR